MKRTEDFLETAKECLVKGRFDVSAFNAGQAAINANDAICIHFLGKRATKDHQDALVLNKQVVSITGDSEGRTYLKDLLDYRRIYGYTEKECSRSEAEKILSLAGKFIAWCRKLLNK